MNAQLCKQYNESINVYNWFAEPKLDGNRGIIIIKNGVIKSISRNNKPMYNTAHIEQSLLKSGFNNTVFDGEFCIGKSIANETWSKTTSILRTQSKHNNSNDLKFWVFDMLSIQDWKDKSNKFNLAHRKECLKNDAENLEHIIYVEHERVINEPSYYLKKYTDVGFEGVVFKNPISTYEFKRSADWLKLKNKFTEEFSIISVQQGTGKYIDVAGAIIINVDGVLVGVGTGMTDIERYDIWKARNSLKGLLLEVSFQSKSKDGSLIFPVFNRIRYDLI